MKTKIMFFLLLSVSTVVQAQVNYEIRQGIEFFLTNKMNMGELKNDLNLSDIQGSPYLKDEFVNGSIYTVQNEEYVDVPMRYNVYNDEMEFKDANGEVKAIAAPEVLEKIEIGNQKLYYIPYWAAKKMKHGYFDLVTGGKASLFIKHKVIFKDAEEPGAYKEEVPARFIKDQDEYYIRIGKEAAVIVGNKKDLFEIFPDHKDNIEAFIKKNKIKTNKAESLLELVNYYNTM